VRAPLILIGLLLGLFVLTALPAAAQESGEAVRGVITGESEEEDGDPVPVEGVVIDVATAGGEAVGSVTTDAEGAYELALPGPGDYTATIDVASLPEGRQLRNPDLTTLEFTIAPGQSRPLLFPLGEPGAVAATGFLGVVLNRGPQLLVEGVKFGLIIAMSAIGLSLIFGTTGLTNFAHGELVTFGAMIAWVLNVSLGLQLIPAAILAIVLGGLAGGVQDRILWRPLRRRGTGLIAMLVISIGLSILLRYVFIYFFGGRTAPYADYAVQQGLRLGPISIAPKDLISIAISVAVLLAVGLALQRTKLGKAMRAVADNRDLAESSGINAEGVILAVWIAGGALATLGGILTGLGEQVSWQMGFQLLLLIFAGVTLGGLGTAYGALVGSLLVGIFVQMSTLVIPPELKNVGALLVLIIVLLFRPQGILGRAERIG